MQLCEMHTCVCVAAYIPNKLGGRHVFPRVPRAAPLLACYLCGFGAQSKDEWLTHIKQAHLPNADALCSERLEEEYRKRLFYYEEFCGPYSISGQEVRRSVSAHALHRTHCYRNGRDANFNAPLSNGQARSLGSCGVCACSFWIDELALLNLWVKPITKDDVTADPSCLGADENDEDAVPAGAAADAEAVDSHSVQHISELLSVSR